MGLINCKMCGSNALTLKENGSFAVCEACGSLQTVPIVNEERIIELYNNANKFRMNADFDLAASFYDMIIKECPTEAEAYWGRCLCKYGIEYVESKADGRLKPTVHRAGFDKMRRDALYVAALDYAADDKVRAYYQDEAKEIDCILSEIISISQKESPYDIFICYKETDENGNRTQDSVLAQDIYSALTDKGYKVFFSRISLKEKLGTQYEPYIFAALNTAELMLAVGTSSANYYAPWVKNEWSRFIKQMAGDNSKLLVPCYKDISSNELPEEIRALEGQRLGELGAMQNLLSFIDSFFGRDTKNTASADAPADEKTLLLRRAADFVEYSQWKEALIYCDKVLDIESENADVRLFKLLVEQKKTAITQLRECEQPFDGSPAFKEAVQYCDEQTVDQLKGINAFIRERNEEKRKKGIYDKAVQMAAEAKTEEGFKAAAAVLADISDYGNARSLAAEYKNKAENIRRGGIYSSAERKMHTGTVTDFEQAIRLFESIRGFGDSEAKITECTDGIKAIREREENARKAREKALKRAAAKKKAKKIFIRSVVAVIVLSVSVGFLAIHIIPYVRYVMWNDITAVSANSFHMVGLKSDGTVVACGRNNYGQSDVDEWTDIVAVSTGGYHSVGLKSDGTVVACGYNSRGQCDVGEWTDIVAVSAGDNHTVGLKSDGTVNVTDSVRTESQFYVEYNVGEWTDIVAVSAGDDHTVGLKSDGTVVAFGHNGFRQCDVGEWTDIIAVAAAEDYTVGVKSDGKFVICGNYQYSQNNADKRTDIVAVAAGGYHTVGVKSDGTVVACGQNEDGRCDVGEWTDIVAVSAGQCFTVGLKSNGRVVVCGKTIPDIF